MIAVEEVVVESAVEVEPPKRKKQNPLYMSYYDAKRRCENPTRPSYKDYGGRGIKFLFESFADFLEALESSWFVGATLDRIDVNGHYCVENCKWSTIEEQNKNQRRSVKLTHNGETLNQSDWAKRLGINHKTLVTRIERWGIERALTTAPHRTETYTFNGETLTAAEWGGRLGITPSKMKLRIDTMGIELAVTKPRRNCSNKKTINFCGEALTMQECAKRVGMCYSRFCQAVRENGIDAVLQKHFDGETID